MTKPYRRRFVFPMAFALAALTASCGGDVTLPDPGEAAELELVDGDDQIAPAGATLAEPVIVRVLDTEERPVTNQEVTFSIVSGGGSVEPQTVSTDADGIAAATWTLGSSAGIQELRARTIQGGSGTPLDVPFTATAVAGSGSVLVGVRGDDQTGPVNSALPDSLVVKATDAVGNPVADVEVTWSVTGGGSISPVTVVTGADGLAAAERVLGISAGPQSARATVEGFTGSPVTFNHTAVPANPTRLLLVAGDDQTGPGGFALADSLVVRLEDENGNGIGNGSILWIATGAGSVSPTTDTTDANGLAATSWTLPSAVGSYIVSAVFTGVPALDPVEFTGTATADAPSRIELESGNNQSATVGTALPNPLVVRVTDANDNPVENVGVTWSAQGGGSVSDATTATDANGLAQVTRTLGLLQGTYTTTASVVGLSGSPVTFISTALVGAPDHLVIITQPGPSMVSGDTIIPVPSVQVRDNQENPVLRAGIQVRATVSGGATLGGEDERLTNTNGRANFTRLTLSGAPGDYQLTFTATVDGVELTPAVSNPITVTAGAAARLVILQQPSSSAQSGDQLAQQPVVQVQDASGNPIAGNRTITVELGEGDDDGEVTGDLTATTGSGSTATFTDLGIEGASGAYRLLFTSGILQPAQSDVITLVNNPPTADNDGYTVDEDEELGVLAVTGVLAGDSDPDGDNLTAVLVSDAANGSVDLQPNGAFTYTPVPDFNGSDSFTYRASDGRGNVSADATVTITVNEVNDPPGFSAGPDIEVSALATALGFTDDFWATDISAGPADETGQTVTFHVSTDNDAAFSMTPQVDEDGTLRFSPAPTLTQLVVQASVEAEDDGAGTPTSAPQPFTITINP